MATRSSPNKARGRPSRPPKTTAPHPVLQHALDDYRTEFRFRTNQVGAMTEPNSAHYALELHHDLNCPSLQQALEAGQAILVTRTNCLLTRTRLTHTAPAGPPGSQMITLDQSSHRGSVEHQSFIISNEDGFLLPSQDLNTDLTAIFPQGLLLPRAAVLAVSESNVVSTQDTKRPVSLIDLKADHTTPRRQFRVALDQERIAVMLHPLDFQAVQAIRSQPLEAAKLHPSLYLSAIHQAVLSLGEDNYRDHRWHTTIADLVYRAQPNLEPDQLKEQSLEIAQQLLDQPLALILPEDPEQEP